MLFLVLASSALVAPPTVAVFGGSGFVGSRVCKALVDCGLSVVSISRAGQPPAGAAAQSWSQRVDWRSADALAPPPIPLPKIDCAVSCVGNMRPSPNWSGFFGLHWDTEVMRRENGEITERIAEAAKRAGASRFVYLSVYSSTKFAYCGALEGYIDGKDRGEAAVRRIFGDANTAFVSPSLIYGGERFPSFGKLYAAVAGSPLIRGQTQFFKALKRRAATGWGPGDAIGEVALTPPCDVDDVVKATVACLLDTIPAEMRQRHTEQQRIENELRLAGGMPGTPEYTYLNVDGTDQIREVAKVAGTQAILAAAAANAKDTEIAEDAEELASGLAEAVAADAPWQSPSAYGSPMEGALMGFKPLLFPWPPGLALFAFFATAVVANKLIIEAGCRRARLGRCDKLEVPETTPPK